MSYMKYHVFLDRKAEKQLENLDPETRKRVTEKILRLQEGFAPQLDIKKLKELQSLPDACQHESNPPY